MIPLISFDAIANVYLTLMFLVPLSSEFRGKSTRPNTVDTRQGCTVSRIWPVRQQTVVYAQSQLEHSSVPSAR